MTIYAPHLIAPSPAVTAVVAHAQVNPADELPLGSPILVRQVGRIHQTEYNQQMAHQVNNTALNIIEIYPEDASKKRKRSE